MPKITKPRSDHELEGVELFTTFADAAPGLRIVMVSASRDGPQATVKDIIVAG
jgi:hypothetical protein